MALGDGASSPAPGGFKTIQEELAYYKTQYEHLEGELQEFQASSKELEAELEKDVEASEQREKDLKQKVETLRYEVDEWKTKYKQSKAEANTAQNTLQKEITTLRDTTRTLQHKLRDIEVANDDYEREARHTTSSLEDMESKYNVAIERNVMMEEEIKGSEQERESLRIEAQRLKDELSDLKIEAEITQEKLRNLEGQGMLQFKRISQMSDTKSQTPQSPTSGRSEITASTNTASTPPAPSEASTTLSEAPTPPSPPLSEVSVPVAKPDASPAPEEKKVRPRDANRTPRPSQYSFKQPQKHARGPSLAVGGPGATPTPTFRRRESTQKPVVPHQQDGLPRDRSLYQIRGLIGKMQKLEERVHSARSKLPAPTSTPPRASPRGTTSATSMPSSVTVRSSKKRSESGTTSEMATPSRPSDSTIRRLSHRPSRLSTGTSSHDPNVGRPSSRASISSSHDGPFAQPQNHRSSILGGRPASRQQGTVGDTRRPRSSLGGRQTPSHAHRPSSAASGTFFDDADATFTTPTARRTTIDKNGAGSAIPTPSTLGRRQSRQMRPPDKRPAQDLGETF